MNPRLPPEPGTVHVWTVSLAEGVANLPRLQQHLSPRESARAKRLIDPGIGRRYAAGRGIVREILSRYAAEPPAALRLEESAAGKPFIASAPDLRFNVSHSADVLLLAVAARQEVGIDVELIREDLDFSPMARTFFSTREQEELFSLPRGEQLHAFYRCWTRKEAFLKGVGCGFSRPSHTCEVTLLPGVPAAVAAQPGAPPPGTWSLADPAVPHGYCAALAAAGTLSSVETFTFTF